MRLAVVLTHPVQYYAPIFRELAKRVDLHVYFGHAGSASHQASAGFGVKFQWDVDVIGGYASTVMTNVSRNPTADSFFSVDTPEISRVFQEKRYDAALVVGWYRKMLMQSIVAAKRSGAAVFVRGDSQLSQPRSVTRRIVQKVAYPTLLRALDTVAYVGVNSREFYEHHRYPGARMFFSPHCVDNDFFSTRGDRARAQALRAENAIAADEKIVLFVGKFVAFKRPADVLRAVATLRRRGARVRAVFVGSGELEASLKALDAELGAQSVFLGFLNQTALPAAYAAADVLALPSTGRETWGLVCNEALACGAPIVVSDHVGCAKDLAADGFVGRTHGLGDVDALAEALAATLEDRPSAAAVQAVAERYTVTRAVDGVMAAAEAGVARRRGAS